MPYTVQQKDKLIGIASELLRDPRAWNEVARFNRMPDPNRINPGQVIRIPLRLLKSNSLPVRVLSTSGDVSVAAGGVLAEGQQVRVGANSSAVLQLGDGSNVKVLPSSLAEVLTHRNYAMRDPGASISTNWFSGSMRVVQGGLEVLAAKTNRRAEALKVQLPTAVVGVRGTLFRAAHGEGAGAFSRTEVLEGEVQADNPAQASTATLAAGFGAVINPAERELRAVALLPALTLANIGSKEITWNPLAGAVRYRVQIARDPQFDAIVRDAVTTQTRFALDVADGNYFVRVRGIDAAGLEGRDASSSLSVATPPPAAAAPPPPEPLPYVTPNEAVLGYLSVDESGDTRLVLPVQVVGTSARFVLARDPEFTRGVSRGNIQAGSSSLGKLAVGTYFVRFESGDGRRISPVYRFEIDANMGVTVFQVMSPLQLAR